MSDELPDKTFPPAPEEPPEKTSPPASEEPPDSVNGAADAELCEQDSEAEQNTAIAATSENNDQFRMMMDRNFLDFAAYVIGSRAIPDVDDGMKPVQRRIMWTLYEAYDRGLTNKTANIVGNAMHYHPHGDQSIGPAVAVLANKGGCVERMVREDNGKEALHYISVPYFIKKEGNFGNILLGTGPAAPRYTECALTKLAYETMFSNDITEFIPNYDGRRKEPVVLPAKIPSLLMGGSDGIAVGMSTEILPHNFNELLDAEIAELRGKPFRLYPDFQQGGIMDVREYDDGNGKVQVRAKIDIDGRNLIIREIPYGQTTGSIISSIEAAAKKNKIRIAPNGINDYTTDHVEICVTPTRGYDPEQTRQGLYMYTGCSVSISPKMMVICERRPVMMTVTEVLKRNVRKLLEYLRREFELELERLNELRHMKTLAQLFFENRIYKRIEECRSTEEEYCEVFAGLAPFRHFLRRDVARDDVDKLLALPVRRIARFDIEKNQTELRELADKVRLVRHHLIYLKEYAIDYLADLKQRYGADFPRRTEIENFEQIDRRSVALNNIKIGWDRKNGYIGTAVRSEDTVTCNEFDLLLLIQKNGVYKIIKLPGDKSYVGKLFKFRCYDDTIEYGVIYREKKSGKYYGKRVRFGGFIQDKEYRLCPEGCQLELFTPNTGAVYLLPEMVRNEETGRELNLMELPLRAAKARGILISDKEMAREITKIRALTEEELSCYADASVPTAPEEETAEEVPEEETPQIMRGPKSYRKAEPPLGPEEFLEEYDGIAFAPAPSGAGETPIAIEQAAAEAVPAATETAAGEKRPASRLKFASSRAEITPAATAEKAEPPAAETVVELEPAKPATESAVAEESPSVAEPLPAEAVVEPVAVEESPTVAEPLPVADPEPAEPVAEPLPAEAVVEPVAVEESPTVAEPLPVADPEPAEPVAEPLPVADPEPAEPVAEPLPAEAVVEPVTVEESPTVAEPLPVAAPESAEPVAEPLPAEAVVAPVTVEESPTVAEPLPVADPEPAEPVAEPQPGETAGGDDYDPAHFELDDSGEPAVRRRRPAVKPAVKSGATPAKNAPEEELGIYQPEFGF